jgi:hypothetical protein
MKLSRAAFCGAGNVLLLRGAISIHSDVSAKTVDELVHLVGERLLASNVIVRFRESDGLQCFIPLWMFACGIGRRFSKKA